MIWLHYKVQVFLISNNIIIIYARRIAVYKYNFLVHMTYIKSAIKSEISVKNFVLDVVDADFQNFVLLQMTYS